MAQIEDGSNMGGEITPLVQELMDRYERCNTWYAQTNKLFLDDLKFAEADSDNGYQWPNSVRRNRDVDERPCLTINKTRQHNLHILNSMKQNKQGIKVVGTGNGATAEAALVMASWCRQVEYQSNAQAAYATAANFMVKAGRGYVRVKTKYEDPKTNNQTGEICRVDDPLTVFIDPGAKELDKSDMLFAILFEDKNVEEFKKAHPEWSEFVSAGTIGETQGWVSDEKVRICEYFRRVEEKFELFAIVRADPQTQQQSVQYIESRDPKFAAAPDVLAQLRQQAKDPESGITVRDSSEWTVEYHFIVGTHEIESERSTFPGLYIPIVPMVAEETVIEGVYDCKGHTRAMKDAQRMYNYWTSTAVEYGALQTKTPWVAPAEAIEDYEVYWNNANKNNNAILPYNALADDGTTQIPPPQRIQPPVAAPVAIQGMQTASAELQMASGQYDNTMAAPGNERTGAAIDSRSEQGEQATAHYQDAQASCIRHVGRILMGIAPVIMDTQRMIQCLGEDGKSFEVMIDPTQQQALAIRAQAMQGVAQQIMVNPAIGRYDVQADSGPAYGTRRKATVDTMALLLTQAPQFAGVIGDIMIRNMDMPEANEAAERLRRMVPQQALGTGPSVAEQQLQAEVQKLQKLLSDSINANAHTEIKLRGKDAKRDVDVANAVTSRLKMLLEALSKKGENGGAIPVDKINDLLNQAAGDAFTADLDPVVAAGAPTLNAAAGAGAGIAAPTNANTPPVPGAKLGDDGHWYVRHLSESPGYRVVA